MFALLKQTRYSRNKAATGFHHPWAIQLPRGEHGGVAQSMFEQGQTMPTLVEAALGMGKV